MSGQVFFKMSGSGNDFVMLDGRTTQPADWPTERIQALCDRRHGVGADGLVILTPDGRGVVRMDFWNCDGSRADMCGNAALCSARLAAVLELNSTDEIRLKTAAGTFPARALRGEGQEAELNLPDFELPREAAGVALRAGEAALTVATVGVPHAVLQVADLEREDLMERGRSLRYEPGIGPAGANVNFVAPAPGSRGALWCVRTYERGVEGETLACGTGAVAAAVALVRAGRTTMPVQLRTRSGRLLRITATLSGKMVTDVWLRGEGRLVFRGVLQGEGKSI
jgi:diaminopimelate epimerase